MADWDPAQYLRFEDERLRPALDLLARVKLTGPAHAVDLGCGAGNVAALLRARFPNADVLGIDSSPEMLVKARRAAPGCRFARGDFADWRPAAGAGAPDLIFSNAALHWVGGHGTLFPRLLSLLAPGGVLAVQMPAMHDAPLRQLQHDVAADGPWAETLADAGAAPAVLAPGHYYDLLRARTAALDIWETIYIHALRGPDAVVEWAAGSSLRPFLAKLPPSQQSAFRAAYGEALRPHYPRRADGVTLLPFRRLFLVATAPGK